MSKIIKTEEHSRDEMVEAYCRDCGCTFEYGIGDLVPFHFGSKNTTGYYCPCPNCGCGNVYPPKWMLRLDGEDLPKPKKRGWW